jgi:hypothetical protein
MFPSAVTELSQCDGSSLQNMIKTHKRISNLFKLCIYLNKGLIIFERQKSIRIMEKIHNHEFHNL